MKSKEDEIKKAQEEVWELCKALIYSEEYGGMPTWAIDNVFGYTIHTGILDKLSAHEAVERYRKWKREHSGRKGEGRND